MFKRILLALTFVAALGAGGLGMSSSAEAGHGCYDYGYRGYGYRSYYPAYYGPRLSYYRSYGSPYRFYGHGHHGHHHHHHDGGLHFSIGF